MALPATLPSSSELPALPDVFQLDYYTARWGEDKKDHYDYDGEIQFVHYNKRYASLKEASQHKDGIAIMVVFMKVDKEECKSQMRKSRSL